MVGAAVIGDTVMVPKSETCVYLRMCICTVYVYINQYIPPIGLKMMSVSI